MEDDRTNARETTPATPRQVGQPGEETRKPKAAPSPTTRITINARAETESADFIQGTSDAHPDTWNFKIGVSGRITPKGLGSDKFVVDKLRLPGAKSNETTIN
jgi:hypothetical protein